MYSPYAKELCELCNQTNNNPSAEQIWSVIHGGNAPADLTLDNLNEKLLYSLCSQAEAYGKLIGRKINLQMISFDFIYSGVPIFKFFDKMKDIGTNDVTFNLADQKLADGFFPKLDNDIYKYGADNYGFGLDFSRGRIPFGAYNPNMSSAEQEGMTITVNNNNETVKFTRKELMAHENKDFSDKYHPYINNMVKHIDGLCVSKGQLASVGTITTQACNMVLKFISQYYKDISGKTDEHPANDYIITKNGDNISVKLLSKPEAKYKYYLDFNVGPNGEITLNEGSLTLPKVSTLIYPGEPPL